MKKLITVTSLLFTSIVNAGLPSQPKFTWNAPTTFEDGTPLNVTTDLLGYKLKCNNDAIVIDIPADVTAYTAPVGTFARGTYTCVMVSISSGGVSSIDSPPKSFDVKLAPARITFTVE